MTKRVLDVGNCDADHAAIARLLGAHFDVQVARCHGMQDALTWLAENGADLITINRLMDSDGSCGLEIIRAIKQDARWSAMPVMLISNYTDAQQAAVQAGAEPGFGKAQLHARETLTLFGSYLN